MEKYKMSNGFLGYDIRVAVKILNHKEIGRNNFLWHLRGLKILDSNNYPTEKYKSMFLMDKISVVTKSGFHSQKIIITDAGLEYFEKNKIYDKVREQDRIYCKNFCNSSI